MCNHLIKIMTVERTLEGMFELLKKKKSRCRTAEVGEREVPIQIKEKHCLCKKKAEERCLEDRDMGYC